MSLLYLQRKLVLSHGVCTGMLVRKPKIYKQNMKNEQTKRGLQPLQALIHNWKERVCRGMFGQVQSAASQLGIVKFCTLDLFEKHCSFTYAQRWPGVGRTESIPPALQSAGWGGHWRSSHLESHPGSLQHTPQRLMESLAPGTHLGSEYKHSIFIFLFASTKILCDKKVQYLIDIFRSLLIADT